MPSAASATEEAAGEHVPVLVVEDEYLVAVQMATALSDAGFEVVGIAATGEEAIAIAAEKRPAIAIVDIRLRGAMDGIEVALSLYLDHGIRSILATANYDRRTQIRALEASPLGWLPKPFEMRSLLLKVRSALRSMGAES